MPPTVAVGGGSKFSPDTNSTPPPRRRRGRNTSPGVPSSSNEPERGRSRVRRSSNQFSAAHLKRRGYHILTLPSLGTAFQVERRFKLVRELGHGAYGTVISAQDEISGEHVAIKQIPRVFEKPSLAKRALREIMLLKHFANHENITGLIDMDALSYDFNELYIFMEPMEADLHQIIRSGQSLTNAHVQYFTYQILRGLKYIHSAGVIHRNLLVNSDCELKICDFGLSRGFDDVATDENATNLTEYVATRWYRAPEIMLSFKRYGKAIDIWSLGCILAELLVGKPLFKGKDYVDQLHKIMDILGTPDEKTIAGIKSERAQNYVRSLPYKEPKPFVKLMPGTEPEAVDLICKVLHFDPDERLTVSKALEHPWLATFHDGTDEPSCPSKFEKWRFIEELDTLEEFRNVIWDEVQEFRKEVRSLSFSVGSRVARQSSSLESQPGKQDGSLPGTFTAFSSSRQVDKEPETIVQDLEGLNVQEAEATKEEATDTIGDPIASYGDVRRGGVLFSTENDGPPESRSRKGSMLGGKLLRSLSTISVHEVAEDTVQLYAKAAVGRYIIEKSAADAPPSGLPKEFE